MTVFFFSSRRRHTRLQGDWSSDVCSSDLGDDELAVRELDGHAVMRRRRLVDLALGQPARQVLRVEDDDLAGAVRSEERRVGKECRSGQSRWRIKRKTR